MSATYFDRNLVALTAASTPVSPYFVSVVDAVDPTAVLALLAVIPDVDGSGLRVFERKGGTWEEAPDVLADLQGVTPPPVVELDRETLLAVIEQIDAYDLANPEGGSEEPPPEEAPAPEEVPPEEAVPEEEEEPL